MSKPLITATMQVFSSYKAYPSAGYIHVCIAIIIQVEPFFIKDDKFVGSGGHRSRSKVLLGEWRMLANNGLFA